MKLILRRLLPFALALALLFTLAPSVLAVPGLTVTPVGATINAGETVTLTATATPGDGADDTVTWEITEGRDVVRFVLDEGQLGADGAVTGGSVTVEGLKSGSAQITASCGEIKETCSITVTALVVAVERVTLSDTSLEFQMGQKATLTARVEPADAFSQTVTWSITEGREYITLDPMETQSGQSVTVTGIRAGSATITATCGGKTATCAVTINEVSIPGSLTNGQMDFSDGVIDTLDTYCRNITGSPLNHLSNISVRTAQGTLYEGYISEAEHGEGVSTSGSYYVSGTGANLLSRIVFVPRIGYNGDATITFTAYSDSNDLFTGRIVVPIPGTSLIYTSESGEPVCFRAADFSSYTRSQSNITFRSVRFELPAASSGILYYNYVDSDIYEGLVSASRSYNRATAPYLDQVWFVPNPSYSGVVTINFSYDDSGGSSYSGFLQVHVVNAAGGGDASVSYSVRPGDSVRFVTDDFNDLSTAQTGAALSYVRFTSLPASASGTLYCAGNSAVTTDMSFYRTGTSGRLLSEVYFTARAGYTGTVSIPFTAEAVNGKTISGTVTITVSTSDTSYATGTIITYSSSGEAVTFRSQDFFYDAAQHLSQPLSTVRFYTPEVSQGRLCANYNSPTSYASLDTSRAYPYTAASSISFQPRAGFSGAAYIGFIASDQSGKSYTGTLAVNVDPPASSSYFNDLNGYSWAVPSTDFLARSNILIGTDFRTFSPAGQTKRGDFILMLQRCFNFPSAHNNVFSDVPEGSYYASAIAGAYDIGLATGDGNGRFRPDASLTRQEAAEFLYRCMRRTGSLQDGTAEDLAAFSDRGQIAAYAATAMATLVRLGVLAGDEGGRLNPTQSLTRAEMAVIFHRALT